MGTNEGPLNGYGELWIYNPLGGYTDTPEEGVDLRGALATHATLVRE